MSLALDFLKDSLNFNQSYKESLDRKASFLLGISSVILVLSFNNIARPGFLLIALGALLASLFSVWVISFPFRKTHRGKFSIICAWGFAHLTAEEYSRRLNEVWQNENALQAAYQKEIFALSEYSIKIKLRFIKLASLSLTLGLVVGFILIMTANS
ncbi:MAG: hypothetical protein HY974_00750 [Candidatus Kerfeldbacteria bacterium]|nr:hypothetical protein [Candidatus Kerfeldbacteria bacterium]